MMGNGRNYGGLLLGILLGVAGSSRSHPACVGLIIVAGCFTMIITPDDPPKPVDTAKRPTVVIDAGHGGKDDGAKCKGTCEKEITLNLALRLDEVLRGRGFRTKLTRTDDRFILLRDRVAIANTLEGETLFISLHFNKAGGKSINGIETFYARVKKLPPVQGKGWKWIGFFNPPQPADPGEYLAADVQSAIIAKTAARDRGIRARDLHVTRHTRCPAILVEGGFMSNTMEGYLLGSSLYVNRLAEGIANGVEAWCGVQPGYQPLPLGEGPKAK